MTDSSQFHAYTDGTDTIIGTSAGEAIFAYAPEVGLTIGDILNIEGWEELGDGTEKIIVMRDEEGQPRIRKTIREWIDWHIANNPDNFSRLLCSTEH